MRDAGLPLALGLLAVLSACSAGAAGGRAPGDTVAVVETPYLARAHSHNNYEQRRPLSDALARGFASIEVDVVLQDGELYVAHGPEDIRRGVTLERLYLGPLREVVQRNGGVVYGPSRPPLQLLIDVKTDAVETYRRLDRTLATYSDLFSSWTPEGPRPGPVEAVLSGNRAIDLIVREPVRYVALDGRATEDRTGIPAEAMPLVSVDWEKLGPADPAERLVVAQRLVDELHGEGRKVRFWATPEREDLWRSLVAIGVDYIGTDEVGRLDRFLRRADSRSSAID